MTANAQIYDLLIASSSWEVRSTSVVVRLSTDHSFKQAVIFRYSHAHPTYTSALEREHHEVLARGLARCSEKVSSIEGDLYDPLAAVRRLDALVRPAFRYDRVCRILFDISSFTKAYLLVFLRYLDDTLFKNNLTLYYTDLLPPQTGRPSEGVRKIISLPFYGGSHIHGKANLLLSFLSFEPARSIAVWEVLEPQLTIPLYSIRRDGRNPLDRRRIHLWEYFLSRPGVEQPVEVPGSDPLGVAKELSCLYARYSNRYNVAVAAVGNKLQSVGVYLFKRIQNVDFQILYPVPAYYNCRYWNPGSMGPSIKIDICSGRCSASVGDRGSVLPLR